MMLRSRDAASRDQVGPAAGVESRQRKAALGIAAEIRGGLPARSGPRGSDRVAASPATQLPGMGRSSCESSVLRKQRTRVAQTGGGSMVERLHACRSK